MEVQRGQTQYLFFSGVENPVEPTADQAFADCNRTPDGANHLLPLVYEELRRLASSHLEAERSDHTLQPTALVHEVYLKLAGQRTFGWENREQFFAAAATAMRRILVDHARKKKAGKRGGGIRPTVLDETITVFEKRDVDLVAMDEALNQLAAFDARKSHIVELRTFAGLTVEETAEILGISVRTVKREWALAKAWLRGELTEQ